MDQHELDPPYPSTLSEHCLKGDPGDKRLHVVMSFQFDNHSQNEALLEVMLSAIDNHSLDVSEELHLEEYGSSGYTRFYIEREVGRLDNALDDEELKAWAVDRIVEFQKELTPILDEGFRRSRLEVERSPSC